RLAVRPNTSPYPASLEDLDKFWSTNDKVLEVLEGTIFSKTQLIQSVVYVGDLQGSLKNNQITIRTELTPEFYSSFRNLHFALTLYLLAMDAKRHNADESVTLQLLAEAQLLLPEPQLIV